jgi:hypothetical protein
MFKLKQPSLVLHSWDVPGYEYRMWASWKMPKAARTMDVISWILYARDQTPELWLRNVVINCHGNDGQLFVGGDGQPTINNSNSSIFTYLRGMDIGTIWLVACLVANTAYGRGFCQRLAQLAGCSVVAADAKQYGAIWCPFGCVDNFEGHTFEWDAAGVRRMASGSGAGIPGVDED